MNIYKILFLFTLSISTLLANDTILSKTQYDYLQSKKEIKICIDPNWYPFEKFDLDGNHIGISSDYFKLFAKQLNIPIIPIKTKSWSQTLEYVENRKCDILTLANETPKRKKYLNFTNPYIEIPFVMVTKIKVNFINNFHHLKNKKIGINKNSALVEILKTKYPNFILVEVKNSQEGIDKILNGELFGYIGNIISVSHILKINFLSELKIMSKLDNEQSKLAIGIRNDDMVLYNIFNKLINNISKDTQQSILHKYIYAQYEHIRQNFVYKYLTEILIVLLIIIIIFIIIHIKLKQIYKRLDIKMKEEIKKNKLQEKYLLQQSKLAQIGEMIDSIAHQWKDPLCVISLAAQSLDIQTKVNNNFKKNDIKEATDTIQLQVNHLLSTMKQFKNFLRPNKSTQKTCIKDLIDSVLILLQDELLKYKITIAVDGEKTAIVNIVPNEFKHILINLINNSKDAFNSKNKEKFIKINIKEINNYIQLSVSDNAGGINKNIINNIFQPNFTTKKEGKGTGIGLYMSKLIIEKINGDLSVQNINNGVEFNIKIPMDKQWKD